MFINYSNMKVKKGQKSIFLAGPTPRNKEVGTWRTSAVEILKQLNFDGIVYDPETNFDDKNFIYEEQVEWEREALHLADVIVFWVPRFLPTMHAFTTNVEFGYWIAKQSDKVVYGRPDEAEKNRYLDWLYFKETNEMPKKTLHNTIKTAIDLINTKKVKGLL